MTNRASIVAALCSSVVLACSSEDAPFVPKATIASVGADPLAGTAVSSCGTYLAEECTNGTLRRCEIYDPNTSAFVDTPDPLLRRVYLYDRWYDLYASPLGLTAERMFDGPMPGDTPESEWGKPEHFADWAGMGDSAIWTGAALVSDIFRYATTRTEADYLRMEAKTRTLLRNFEVTGIPGYLARYHFLDVPAETPQTDRLILHRGRQLKPTNLPIENAAAIDGLPPEYQTLGTPYWDGDVSIDQYTGPMTAFPIAYNLLRDEELQQKLTHHLTCYLKRLQRIEIINLKARPELITELQNVFGGSSLRLDPDDPDINELSEMVWFVHRGINTTNASTFDRTCPDTLPLTPGRVLDGRSATFESELLELATDINRSIRTRPNQIDHFYIVSIRGGDASHLMHLAAIAYYLTGEEQYKKFLFDELIGKLRTDDVARTMMAFRLPDWCFRFYGDHITYGTHWQLITLLPEGELKNEMMRVMEEEIRQKALFNHKSAKFDAMYASVMSGDHRAEAIASLNAQLRAFGGNGGTQDAPRRTHIRERADVIAALPSGITVRCPTAEERTACEQGGTLFGFPLESTIISYDCDGRAGECMMADGKCVEGLASDGLPSNMRGYSDFMWQRSPFSLGDRNSVDGQEQSPGRDLSEPYWLARYYDFVTEGKGQVLAWKEGGACP